MVISIDADGRYCVALSQTEQVLLDKISSAAAQSPEKFLGNLLFGALVIRSLEVGAMNETKSYNPADRD